MAVIILIFIWIFNIQSIFEIVFFIIFYMSLFIGLFYYLADFFYNVLIIVQYHCRTIFLLK